LLPAVKLDRFTDTLRCGDTAAKTDRETYIVDSFLTIG